MNRGLVARQRLIWLAVILAWAFLLWRAMVTFAPSTDINDVGFNSDSAIPVLMSNEARPLSTYRLYYYGADRWGAWPFLVTRWIGQQTGHRWTDDGVFRVQALWIFVGALAFASLNRDGPIIAGLLYLVSLCLNRDARYLLFELSQVYAWQLTGVLLAWWSVRRVHEAWLETTTAAVVVRRIGWFVATFVFSYLATWSSVASTIFLLFLLHVEVLRAALTRSSARGWARLLVPYALTLVAIGGAAVLEQQQKNAYRHYTVTQWGQDFSTYFFLDRGYLWENLLQQVNHLSKISWWPLYVLPVLALVAALAALIYAFAKRDTRLRAELTDALTSDTGVLAISCLGLATINFALAFLVSHVRFNGYDSRYLTLTHQFAPLSGMLALVLFATVVARRWRVDKYVPLTVGLLAAALLIMRFPTARLNIEYVLQREAALTLATRAPNAVLLGSYWETYIFPALQPQNPAIPVPFEGPFNRTPWTGDAVRRAREVIVGSPRANRQAVSMPPTLDQYGCRLRLIEPHWYDNALYSFGLYANDCRRRRS